ncbi:hypothetical protein GIB67_030143 [Kingdonia uniflora]|uniref:Uncharacterized protein n=1 Tax=Kingdonia uniflora TaxID=39325 RepID=A0A7J7LEF7_9MAGN|nr:hypothetical protein GIB67_030143 [Kingdonia uniflora]
MVGYYFLVPSLLLRVKLWLDDSSWYQDSSSEIEIPMFIYFSLVELVQYIVPLYPAISCKVVSGFSCCYGDLWGAELEAHSLVVTFGLAVKRKNLKKFWLMTQLQCQTPGPEVHDRDSSRMDLLDYEDRESTLLSLQRPIIASRMPLNSNSTPPKMKLNMKLSIIA